MTDLIDGLWNNLNIIATMMSYVHFQWSVIQRENHGDIPGYICEQHQNGILLYMYIIFCSLNKKLGCPQGSSPKVFSGMAFGRQQ